jgi:prepilin-type N-terminal cleavage/methylation domain-containing protein
MQLRRNQRGFTLVEIVIAASIAGVLSAAALGFLVYNLKSVYSSQQQMKLLSTMRTLNNEFIRNASRAHEYVMYDSTNSADRDEVADRKSIEVDASSGLEVFPTGNFVVFITYELPKPATQNKYRIASVTGYYPRSTSDGRQELVKMTIAPSTPSTDTLEDLIADNWDTAPRTVIASRINALALSEATSTSPQMFYMHSPNNLAVCGQLFASNAGKDTKNAHTFTRTFYFTLTVRS